MIRRPAVAGRFYAGSEKDLEIEIKRCFEHNKGPGSKPGPVLDKIATPVGLISPHAGYVYSGPVAAHAYFAAAEVGKPERVVIIGPNHTGYGRGISAWPHGSWRTPLGSINVDQQFVEDLENRFGDALSEDTTAHILEHSVEVQIPFLQVLYGNDFLLVPLIMADQSIDTARKLAGTFKEMVSESEPTLFVASSDLNHYESHEVTSRKDEMLIRAIEKRDDEMVYRTAHTGRISACGLGPVCVLLNLFSSVTSLAHATSGDICGELAHTVGYYAAILGSY